MSIDHKVDFVSVNIALLTISDTRTSDNDKSGNLLKDRIIKFGHKVIEKLILKDDVKIIEKTILNLSSKSKIDVIITSGGTGFTGRDSTPEAINLIKNNKNINFKHIEGFGELFRKISYDKIGTSAIQSRALGVVINNAFIFCLPGSPNACKDAWDKILQYQLDIRHKPCNFIEIIPRINEQ